MPSKGIPAQIANLQLYFGPLVEPEEMAFTIIFSYNILRKLY
jgi:hypothetical protein